MISIQLRTHCVMTTTAARRAATAVAAAATVVLSMLAGGCSTTQQVHAGDFAPKRPIVSVSRLPEEGNTPEMNAHLESALRALRLRVKAPLVAGLRTPGVGATDVDALVSYAAVFAWDLAFYLKTLTVRLYDAQSGDLLVTGTWKDSPMHGFRDEETVMHGLVAEVFEKLPRAQRP